MRWAPAARDQAFHVADGDVFRWSWMWGRIAGWFGMAAAPFYGTTRPLEAQMTEDGPLWRAMGERQGLGEPDLGRLASPWRSDADLGRPIEVVADMSRSRRWASAPTSLPTPPSSRCPSGCGRGG